jgi:hypothetical protein
MPNCGPNCIAVELSRIRDTRPFQRQVSQRNHDLVHRVRKPLKPAGPAEDEVVRRRPVDSPATGKEQVAQSSFGLAPELHVPRSERTVLDALST